MSNSKNIISLRDYLCNLLRGLIYFVESDSGGDGGGRTRMVVIDRGRGG